MSAANGIGRLLITGTTGFLGRNLKEYYQAMGADIVCPPRAELNLLDSDGVLNYLERHRFDAVIHCGVTLLSVEENLKMYFNLERGAHLYGRMICVGSGAEYDRQNYTPKMQETYFGSHIPTDIYGFSKYVINKDIEARPRNIYNMRVFGIFGPYEDYRRRFISNNICRLLSGLDISVMRNAGFDYLYVKDFLAIMDQFLTKDLEYRTYNVCTGESVDLVSIAHMIRDVHGQDVDIVVKEPGFNPEYSGDNSRFVREFGWNHFTDLKVSIAELYDWYKNSSNLTFTPDLFR